MGGGERKDAEAELNLPPGFRFHPTDDELVVHYLCRKAAHQPLPVPIIADVDLYKFDPWDLPEKALFGQREWYFFTPRDRKYPNGSRPNRAAGRGYWKATGADKPVSPPGSGRPIAIKKALVFYNGKAPKGVKTDWIMHEYRLADTNRSAAASGGKKAGLRLDEWVLCRLYNKKNNWEKTTEQFTESMDETASESLWTPESDIDHPSPDLDQQQGYPAQPYYNPGFLQPVKEVKEENDWFLDLNLEDLQGSLPAFGSGNSLELPSQDYYYSTLDLPQLRQGQSGGMPPPF